ncbi:MBL fold metallo-hydrolase [bacterium]|nr:MBL fold metallo-hydrolase [candidate division CSSED10-310 bacterium]
MKLSVLGTSGASVTSDRDNTFFMLESGPDKILIDCAGDPARKILRTGSEPLDLDLILITHLHIDHCYGLPALLFHLYLNGRTDPLPIAAPEEEFEQLLDQLRSYGLGPDIRTFSIRHIRVPSDDRTEVCRTEHNHITASPANHSRAARAYRIESLQTGKSIVFSGDSRYSPAIRALAENATVLVHESTYLDSHKGKADEYGHCTARDAAIVAREAGVSSLVLVHLDTGETLDENEFRNEAALQYHGSILIPKDLDILVF